MEYVHKRMEDTGVNTSLVFDMGTIERAIARMESIAKVLFVVEPHQSIAAVRRLLDDVMNARREDMSLRALFRENTALIARKIVERSGKAGEPYIANSRSEYRALWRASLGGGLLTVLTAVIKMRITDAHFPPFVEGMAAGTNYAVSFIVLQYFHLALATKQPSVTAAAFAGIVRTTSGRARLEKVTEFISRITRSQLASAAGNLLAVGLGCIVFAKLWVLLFSRPYLEISSAEHVYETLDPFASGTGIYAAITGVILWISALAGGWFENFATFNHVSAAIAQHPLGRKVGLARMKRLADLVDANLSGWTTSIVLGYLLGFVLAVGHFLGIPLDVRHVTLSTGTLALAAASFGKDWLYRGWFIYTVFGIAVIFVMNLGVSFSIAAAVGMKAYSVSSSGWFAIRLRASCALRATFSSLQRGLRTKNGRMTIDKHSERPISTDLGVAQVFPAVHRRSALRRRDDRVTAQDCGAVHAQVAGLVDIKGLLDIGLRVLVAHLNLFETLRISRSAGCRISSCCLTVFSWSAESGFTFGSEPSGRY